MTEKRAQRRLAALLAADVVGYSRLIEQDDAGTIATLKRRRKDILMPVVAQHHGRVVNFTGDGVLVEFASAIDAVQCAVKLQDGFATANLNLPETQHIVLRIGVNLGDIIVEGQLIYGDGVNIAARLEALAEPGRINISANILEQVSGKLPVRFDDLGEHVLKNIAKPARVYRVGLAGEKAGITRPALKLPAKPSIAVLPFVNMTNDQTQDVFAEGISEDILTALSRIGELFVISRSSSFIYKGKTDRLENIARELGVRFILEGSIRISGSKARVTAQLIDGQSGSHVWAENYDRNLDDVFAVQDEITRNIVLALQIKLTYGELARLWEGQTKDLRAWEKMALGRNMFLQFTVADNRQACLLLKQAIEIDPNYTGAMIQLGLCYWWQARFVASADKEISLQLSEQQVQRALAIDPNMGSAYMLRGGNAFLRDQYDDAIELCEKAIELAPSDSWAMAFLGLVCIYGGKAERALTVLNTAMRLSPHPPSWYIESVGMAKLWTGDLAGAEAAAEENLRLFPDDAISHMHLATVYGFQDRHEDAARLIDILKRKFSDYDIGTVIYSERYREREKLDKVIGVLRTAGLPEPPFSGK
jgi:adenylate cyclase